MKRKKYYLFKLLFILGVIFIASPNSFPQQFKLTNINSTNYSIDKIAQEIYFKDILSDTVRKVTLKNLEVIETYFKFVPPILSNKFHLIVYGDTL